MVRRSLLLVVLAASLGIVGVTIGLRTEASKSASETLPLPTAVIAQTTFGREYLFSEYREAGPDVVGWRLMESRDASATGTLRGRIQTAPTNSIVVVLTYGSGSSAVTMAEMIAPSDLAATCWDPGAPLVHVGSLDVHFLDNTNACFLTGARTDDGRDIAARVSGATHDSVTAFVASLFNP